MSDDLSQSHISSRVSARLTHQHAFDGCGLSEDRTTPSRSNGHHRPPGTTHVSGRKAETECSCRRKQSAAVSRRNTAAMRGVQVKRTNSSTIFCQMPLVYRIAIRTIIRKFLIKTNANELSLLIPRGRNELRPQGHLIAPLLVDPVPIRQSRSLASAVQCVRQKAPSARRFVVIRKRWCRSLMRCVSLKMEVFTHTHIHTNPSWRQGRTKCQLSDNVDATALKETPNWNNSIARGTRECQWMVGCCQLKVVGWTITLYLQTKIGWMFIPSSN